MKNNTISISTRNVTGFGVGTISNENTLIKFVIMTSKKLSTWFSEFVEKNRIKSDKKKLREETPPLFI
ncbi:hypothetical protein [Ulvibacterium marinum]|uniref:Uncharacterized protein n=1 Tax=Ulvibacterium marinum TaxID=2419782 RepID=A0A3B0C9Z3_9FLAO|nr:hypothetical protein [Ulvibacterium marinum]RKN81374.1 hypothetical protein D7Z94_10605 [Ulvibacterium marinum]